MKQVPATAAALQVRSRRDSANRNQMIRSLRRDPSVREKLVSEVTDGKDRGLLEFCRTFLGPQGSSLFNCGFGAKPSLDAYGRLQPCLGLRAPEFTVDLRQTSLAEAISTFFPSLKKKETSDPEYLRRCGRCFLKGLCEQCPCWSWSENGTLDTPVEYLCSLAHEQARRMGLLSVGEQGWTVADWEERLSTINSSGKSIVK
jgi:radical SAM protein with 4Fe4S-binding SPASM domain